MFQSHSDDDETNIDQTSANELRKDDHDDDGNDDETGADKSSYCTRNDISMDRDSVTRRCSSDHGHQAAVVIEVDLDAKTSETAMTSRGINNEDVGTADRSNGDDQMWWRRHTKPASNNKFLCSLCGYQQSSVRRLKRHICATHLGFKPFACKYCDFSSIEPGYLKIHIKKRHPGLAFDFVQRKYPERDCTVGSAVPNSDVGHGSTAVVSTSHGALSSKRGEAIAMGETHCHGESVLINTSIAQTDAFTEVKKRCAIEQTLNMKPEPPLSDPPSLNVSQHMKFYKCIYCDFCSEDRLCDVRDHIFVSHLRRNRFSCVHCAFGSMTKGDVAAHCLAHHPGKDQKVNEDKDHSRSITILETHGDVRLVGMLSNDNVPLIELPTNLQEDRGETRVVETSGVSRLAVCETSGAKSTVPNTTSTLSRTYLKYGDKVYKCKKCEFSRTRRCVVREHVAYVHLGMKRFRCPYCAMEHSNSNSIRNHIRTSHPGGKVHLIYPMMQKLKLVGSYITMTRSQQGVNATTLSDTPNQQRRKKRGNGSGLELRKNVRTVARVGNRSTTTSGLEPASDDTSGTREDGKSAKSRSFQIVWKCTTCRKRLARFKEMMDHVLTCHMSLQPYQCAVCDFGACSNDLVRAHIQDSHQHSRIDIPVVDVVAEKADCLKKKMIRVRVKKAIVPPVETDSCETFDYGQLRTVGKNGKSVYRCDLCDHEVNGRYNIKIHRESRDRHLSLFGCNYCAYKVNRIFHMEKHIKKVHTGRKIKYHPIQKGGSLMEHKGANQNTLAQSSCEMTVPDSDGQTALIKKTPHQKSTALIKKTPHQKSTALIKKTPPQKSTALIKKTPHQKSTALIKKTPPQKSTALIKKTPPQKSTALIKKTPPQKSTALIKKTPPQKSTVTVTAGVVACESVIPSSEDGASMNDEERPMFACLMCGKKNVLWTSVRQHILFAHLKYRPFKCNYCMHASTNRRGVRDHITSKHAGQPCNIAYNIQKELEAIADANIIQAINATDDVKMPSDSMVNDSVKLPEGRLEGVETSRQSSTDDADKPAESKELPTEAYLCVVCKTYSTTSKVAMLRHIAIEIEYLPFVCPHCSFSASRQNTVRNHIKIAHPGLMICVKINKDEAKERRAVELLETSVVAHDSDAFSDGKQLYGECTKCLRVTCGDLGFALVSGLHV